MFEKYGGPLTPAQRQSIDQWTVGTATRASAEAAARDAAGRVAARQSGSRPSSSTSCSRASGDTATISFYAAGIGVMFLLFSCAGAGGTLLEEEEAGTLGRLIGSRAGMGGVLFGKWLFVAIMGIAAAHA